MILPLAELTALALSCGSIADPSLVESMVTNPVLLKKIGKVESGFNTLAIGDNTTKQSHFPQTEPEAIDLARRLLAAGHSIDAGMMQINSANFTKVGLTPEKAFEPCASVRAAVAILVSAISQYNTGSETRGIQNGYVQRVMAANPDQPNPAVVSRKVARTATPSVNAAPVEPPRGPSNVFSNGSGEPGSSFLITATR